MLLTSFQDELDDVSVKQGFTHRPQIQDEYSSARSTSITPAKVCIVEVLDMCINNFMHKLPVLRI